jgi:hypothetical protein
MRRTVLITLTLATIALSGCGAKERPFHQEPGPSSPDNPFPSTNTSAPPRPKAAPPVANLSVDVAEGPAPLIVNITVNASAPNGTHVTEWRLELGDGSETDGLRLPFTLVRMYPEGRFQLNLTVTTDAGTEGTDNVTLISLEAREAFVHDFEIPAPCPGCRTEPRACLPAAAAPEESVCASLTLDAELEGRPFRLNSTQGDPDLAFLSTCTNVGVLATHVNAGEETGDVPQGARCVIVWEHEKAESVIRLTVT